MKRYDGTCYTDKLLIKGCVTYENEEPVKGAIVILEQLYWRAHPYDFNSGEEAVYSTYTTTNYYGEFCFFIYDRTKYYKIKIFDNQYNCKHYRSSNINIDLE